MRPTLHEYNRILGVNEIHSVDQLKTVYRKRAKFLHPDSNEITASHEQFVLLQQAYEYYLRLFEKGAEGPVINQKDKRSPHHQRTAAQSEMWKEAQRRAAEQSRTRNAKFAARGYERILAKMFHLVTVVRVLQALLLFLGLPIFIYMQDGIRGLICVIVVQGFTHALWWPYIKVIFRRRRRRRPFDYFYNYE